MTGMSIMQDAPMEGFTMSETKLFVGLCATCNNAESCVYRKRTGTDAIYCEMFDDYVPPSSKDIPPVTVTTPETAEPGELKGLCVNCAHRDTCKLPRPKGGVWHCEEYE